jgi:predicted ATPase
MDLARHTDERLVPTTVAAALGIGEDPRVPQLEMVIASLGSRSALLILDNCVLITACSNIADALLRACPGVRTLPTSRQPLAVAVFAVPALSLGDSAESFGAQGSEALRLFLSGSGWYSTISCLTKRALLWHSRFVDASTVSRWLSN